MKAILLCLAFPLSLTLAESPAPAANRDLRKMLQEGLFEEEANRNLENAATAYDALLQAFDQYRQYAATALFRLAEVRAKQNRKDEAIALYQRVVSEFGKDPLAKTSRDRLAALGSTAPAEGAPAIADEESAEIARLQDLVKNSPDLLNASKDEVTPLGRAAQQGWRKAAAYLLDNGADIGGRFGTPALNLAATHGRKAMVELLLDRGADVNGKSWAGNTALADAIRSSRPEVARLLLDRGANPDLTNREAQTPLFFACQKGDIEMVRLLSKKAKVLDPISEEKPPVDYPGATKPTITPLIMAIQIGNLEIVKLLVEQGADVNKEAAPQTTPLRRAISTKNREILEYLIDRGAKVSEPGLFYWAVRTYPGESIPILIKHGANLNETDGDFGAPLHFAAETSLELTETLLAAGANPNVTNPQGQTPLHKAVSSATPLSPVPRPAQGPVRIISPRPSPPGTNQPQSPDLLSICKLLVSKGAKVNPQDSEGKSVLYTAIASQASEELIQFLLDHGADPYLKTKHGHDAFTLTIFRRLQVLLDIRFHFSKWAKGGGITVIDRFTNAPNGDPLIITPVSEFDSPPDTLELIRKVIPTSANRIINIPVEFEIRVYRPGKEGHFAQFASSKVNMYGSPMIDPPLPRLLWNDVLVPLAYDGRVGTIGSLNIIPLFKESAAGRRTVNLEIGDRKTELRMAGDDRNWSPVSESVPVWNFSELISRITKAEPSADLGAIKVRRIVDGQNKEWTVDLRSKAPGGSIRDLPARLADGDTIHIPILDRSDADALTRRRSGIHLAAPGRVLGQTIFSLAPTDDAPRTLGEFVTCAYVSSPLILPNPDFSRIKIHRMKGDDGSEETLEVDFAAKANQVNPSTTKEDARKLDVPLEPGDIVEIPVIAGQNAEAWKGLPGQMRLFLGHACTRSVKIGSGSELVILKPFFLDFRAEKTGADLSWEVGGSRNPPFRAMSVVKSTEKLLKARIISRGKTTEYTPEEIQTINPWLLDGDHVETDRY